MKKLDFGYHITSMTNWLKIKNEGLIPRIGTLSKKINESNPKIYFFISEEEAENALLNWLGDEIGDMISNGFVDEDEKFVLLKVSLSHLNHSVEKDDNGNDFYEQGIEQKIESEYIEFLREV